MTELENLYKLAHQCQQVGLNQAVERIQKEIIKVVNSNGKAVIKND